jgi:molybdopterin converting factor subunit 1
MAEAIQVLFFARARELSKSSEADFQLPDGADTCTLRELLNRVGEKFPSLLAQPAPLLDNCAFALNQRYVLKENLDTAVVRPGDEVALIPPVSGG